MDWQMSPAAEDQCSSGYQSIQISNYPSASPSAEAPAAFAPVDCPNQPNRQMVYCQYGQGSSHPNQAAPAIVPPPKYMTPTPSYNQPHYQNHQTPQSTTQQQQQYPQQQFQQQPQQPQQMQLPQALQPASEELLKYPPKIHVEELLKIMIDDKSDIQVFTNSVYLLYAFMHTYRGPEFCMLVSNSPDMINCLNYALTHETYKNDEWMIFCGTGILAKLSESESGRKAIIENNCVRSLIHSLQAKDVNGVVFAITAIHHLLIDSEVREFAKKQLVEENQNMLSGLSHIVKLLDHRSDQSTQWLRRHYEFKGIVLDCLHTLAYSDENIRNAITQSDGSKFVLQTIEDYLNDCDNQHNEELLKFATRVLKVLSGGRDSRSAIVNDYGVEILTRCTMIDNHEILKTCLWTLRNLSDLINQRKKHDNCISQLVIRLLNILDNYSSEPTMIMCALCIIENLSYNNPSIKHMICSECGVVKILSTLPIASRDPSILDPALCALVNLLNQEHNDILEMSKKSMNEDYNLNIILQQKICLDPGLTSTVQKLSNLLYTTI